MRAAAQAPFILTMPGGQRYEANYGSRLYVGTGAGVRTPVDGNVQLAALRNDESDWISAVALEIVVNQTNIAIYVNQRSPGLLIASEPGLSAAESADPALRHATKATFSGETYLTARRHVELSLRQQPSAGPVIDIGEMWFEQDAFSNYRGGTLDVSVSPPAAMWLRCMVAATTIFRQTEKPASWREVNAWLAPRCRQQDGFRPGRETPKEEQQYSMWEAVRAYGLQPYEYSLKDDKWRSVQRALVARGLPTPDEVAFVEARWDEYWLPYNDPLPVQDGAP